MEVGMYNISICQKVQPFKNFKNIKSIKHDIVKPRNNILSYKIKKQDDQFVYFNFYKDNNETMKNKILPFLKKISGGYNNNQIFKKIKELTKTYRYFIKTDIIGAYYNFSLELVYNTILSRVNNRDIRNYLIGFFEHINNHHENYQYLYVSDYSEYIFRLFLQDNIKNENVIYRIDDIILYGNNLTTLKEKLKELSLDLSLYSLYLNPNKTCYIDVIYDSIYIFKTIVITPLCGVLDNKIKDTIKELIDSGESINVYEMGDDLYEYFNFLQKEINETDIFPKPEIKVSYTQNIKLYKRLVHNLFEYLYRSDTINNNLSYKPTNKNGSLIYNCYTKYSSRSRYAEDVY